MLDRRSLGVYVVTSNDLYPGRTHRHVALAAIEGGASAIQLRAPELDDRDLLPLATELAGLCREAGVVFVVNDRLDVALLSGADGVHLGQGDDLDQARSRIGENGALGISVNDAEEAGAAEAAGADYLGVTVWATSTKPEAVPLDLEGLRAIVGATTLPVVGIGGIQAANAWQVIHAGATGVAVVSAVAAAEDPVDATRKLAAAVRTAASTRGGSS
ncbi:MAG: thiamine phosphate synthase [Actinomycetota bacterium]